jgi:NNP family nitrate/nitrite transporter-like MFS transporter
MDSHVPQAEAIQNSFSSSLGPLLSLAGIFFLNFFSRIALSPLLPTIEKDLGVGHGEAGSFFLLISLGYFAMLLASNVVSSQLSHRRTILLSSVLVGCALLFVSMSQGLWGIRLGFVLLGMAAGLYLPSGIVTLTALVRSKDLGKAMAVHELAPNLAFVVAPLLVETLLRWGSW